MRIRVGTILTLLLATALAGCASDPNSTTDTDASGNPAPIALPPVGAATATLGGGNGTLFELPAGELPVSAMRYLGTSTFEPTIGSDADGCLYFTQFRGTGAGTRIMMSCDQGDAWTDIGPNLPTEAGPCFPNSNDPFVHVDYDTGRVFSSDLHALVTSTLHFTDDKGASWTCNVLGGGVPPGVHDHQSIITAAPRLVQTVGYENVVYYCINRVGDSSCATSINGGIGFGPMVTVFPGVAPRGGVTSPLDSVCGGLTGHAASDNEGRVFFPRSFCGSAQVGITEDDGLTWTGVVIDETKGVQGHEVRIASDDAGNVYAFWIGADFLPYLAVSTDHGFTWGEPIMVGPSTEFGAGRPAIEAGADGNVVLAYIGYEHEAGADAPAAEMKWNGYMGIVYNALDANPTIFTVKAKATPIDDGRNCAFDRCGGIGDFIDVTIDPEGRPWAAFSDQCNGEDNACSNNAAAFTQTLKQGRSLRTGLPLTPLGVVVVAMAAAST